MAFTYTVVERENKIANAKSPRVAVAYGKMIGRVTTKELSEQIAKRCTFQRAEVAAVLDLLSDVVMLYMSQGLGVQLGELGSFSLSVRSKSAPTKKEFKSELLKRAVIRYTPSLEMKDKLNRVGFQNIEDLMTKYKEGTPTEPGTTKPVPTEGDNTNPGTNPGGGSVGEI